MRRVSSLSTARTRCVPNLIVLRFLIVTTHAGGARSAHVAPCKTYDTRKIDGEDTDVGVIPEGCRHPAEAWRCR